MAIKAAVVIPTHKETLSELEKISLVQCRKVLARYPLIFALPEGKNFSFLQSNDKVIHFDQNFFRTLQGYNRLMMTPLFYEAFRDYDYILIYELDAFVFYDALEYFCSLGYDYIGAPWPRIYADNVKENFSRVGNGGFSLRNVKACYRLLKETFTLASQWSSNEDIFFSYCGNQPALNFRVAPINVAYKFSAEFNPARVVKKNGGNLPFGCHAWLKSNAEFYVKVFAQFGYDLSPLREQMKDDGGQELMNWLINDVAMQRLIRRLQRGQPLRRYLPQKNFASVRVIRHPLAIAILTRLLMEDNSLANEIFIYAPDEQDILLNDLTLQRRPHLLIASGGVMIRL